MVVLRDMVLGCWGPLGLVGVRDVGENAGGYYECEGGEPFIDSYPEASKRTSGLTLALSCYKAYSTRPTTLPD